MPNFKPLAQLLVWFPTGDMEDRFILDVMDDLVLPKGRYPKTFVLISLLEVCQEWGVFDGVL